MAATRRSTRQAASAPTYAEPDSSLSADEAPKPKGKKTAKKAAATPTKATRRKRPREDDDDEAQSPPPPKKASKSNKANTKPAKPRPLPPPSPSSSTNRDASGAQQVFWLLKAEPLPRYENGVNVAFSIDDLAACTEPEPWSGVRNPQARNNMQAMRVGDLGFFYHSNAKPSGVVGILRVVEEAKVDETAFDAKDPYYDAKSQRENPKWYCVGVEFVKKFDKVVDLHTIKSFAAKGGALENMQLITNGRLSVSKVQKEEWDFVMELAGEKEASGDTKDGAEAEDDHQLEEETNA